MKKLMLLTIVAFSIISCSKNEAEPNDALTSLAKEVLKQSDFATMQQAYQILSVDEKGDLWKAKLETVLRNDKQNLSKEKYNILASVNKFFKENTFKDLTNSPEIGEKFLKDNLPYFQKYFTKVELYMLLQSPYFDENFSIKNAALYAKKLTSTVTDNTINMDENYAPNNCECRYDMGCPGWNNTCEENKGRCNRVNGCGIFGTSDCTGRCYLSPA